LSGEISGKNGRAPGFVIDTGNLIGISFSSMVW
jgi:hypothetical protein